MRHPFNAELFPEEPAIPEVIPRHDQDNQKQLGKTLWSIADQLRGAMNADDFRDYMLAFAVPALPLGQLRGGREEGTGPRLPRPECGRQRRAHIRCPSGTSRIPSDSGVREQMRKKAHYVIRPEHLWTHIAHLARTQGAMSCSTRCKLASSTSRTSHSKAPSRGCSRRSTSASDKLGKTYADRNAKLCTIISQDRRGAGRVLDRQPTRSATRTSTSSASSPRARARRRVSSTRLSGFRVHPLGDRHARQPGAEDRHHERNSKRVRLRLRVGLAAAQRAHGAWSTPAEPYRHDLRAGEECHHLQPRA